MELPDSEYACPHCGATLAADASFCPECGASSDSGWDDDSESFAHDAEDEFDYDDFVRREFPEQHTASPSLKTVVLWCIVILTLISFCVMFLNA